MILEPLDGDICGVETFDQAREGQRLFATGDLLMVGWVEVDVGSPDLDWFRGREGKRSRKKRKRRIIQCRSNQWKECGERHEGDGSVSIFPWTGDCRQYS